MNLEYPCPRKTCVFLLDNALIFHVYNDSGHETCVDTESFYRLACAIVYLAARSFVCWPAEKKDGNVKEHKYMLEQI